MTAARGEGVLRNLVVREGRRTGAIQVRLVTGAGARSTATRWRGPAPASTGCCGPGSGSLAETTRAARPSCWPGPSASRRMLGAMRFAISAEAFFQTNTEMAERLYELAIEYAQPTGFERVYDLYCGIGTIALLDRSARGRGVGARAGRGGDRRRDRQRAAPTRSTTRTSSPATCGWRCASWWSEPDAPTW